MLFEEKKSHFWLVQYSKGLKFWKQAYYHPIEWTHSEYLRLERAYVSKWRGKKLLGVKALTKEQYDDYKKKGY